MLTGTNEEALRFFTLLKRRGLPVRLQQGMDGFSLASLQELRVFLNYLDTRLQGSPVFSRELWEQAKAHTERVCQGSEALGLCRRLWRDFEETGCGRYRSDLENFIRESREEDFLEEDRKAVTVSTVHKAKGREFDQVWLMQRENREETEEEKRRIYVGLSRAKDELYLHVPGGGFAFDLPKEIEVTEEESEEPAPPEIMLQLGHRDVVLSFFRSREELLGRLLAGVPLRLEGEYLTAEAGDGRTKTAKLSRACLERIGALQARGYRFREGKIRYVVAWKPEDGPECWIVLPDLVFELA